MRHFLVVTGIIFLTCTYGQSLKEADDLLFKGDMTKAMNLYESIESTGEANASMYRNMALIHLQNDSIGKSILYLEKAQMMQPFNSDIKKQIQLVRQKYNLPEDLTENQTFYKIVYFFQKIHARYWWILSLILAGILGSWVIKRFPIGKPNIKEIYLLVTFAAGILLSSAAGFIQYNHQGRQMIALKTHQMRISPDAERSAFSELPEGSKVMKTDELGEWTRVKDFYGDEGWVPSSTLASVR